ncbi:MAG: spermidine/putrescine ABC transporter ATP-binding subunit [Parasphingorhabdus sp.]|jgi:spermidine/putrescine ABC transporter ATP-binding subunit
MTAIVELENLSKFYGQVAAVHPLNLEVKSGEFLAILGPSGCGKTTLLRMIGGFVEPTSGVIKLAGEDVTSLGPDRRPTNMVFQGYGLFPHMTVGQNVAYGLRLAKVKGKELSDRVQGALDLVHLSNFGERKTDQLSGGQRQRIALARALVMRPKVLLLDEPLAALDLKLRQAMQEEFRRIHAATGGTFVFVTHDQEEAMSLANRICVMEAGRIVQDGDPEEIYSHPCSRFVSTFIGEANLFKGCRKSNVVELTAGISIVDEGPDEDIVCVVRPEKIRLALPDEVDSLNDSDHSISATVLDAVFLGPFVQYSLRTSNDEFVSVDSRDMEQRKKVSINGEVRIGWNEVDQRILTDQ